MAVLEYHVTMDDVLEMQREHEAFFGVQMVLELKTTMRLGKPLYWVECHVYHLEVHGPGPLLATGKASYPTRTFPTFPGACLHALMDGAERASAQKWLRSMEAQRGKA